jgi:membrane-bound ClpP family serine protease
MEYSTWAFLLLAIAVCLLIAEVFIPSGGVISILATLSVIGAIICAWNAWWHSSPGNFWAFLAGMMILLPVTIGVAFYFWPSTPLGRRAILPEPQPHEVTSFVEQEERYRSMVGQIGATATSLNPAGIATIDGQRVHCQSEGMILDAGVPVIVIAARGNRVVVRKYDPHAARSDVEPPHRSSLESGSPLDFDMS